MPSSKAFTQHFGYFRPYVAIAENIRKEFFAKIEEAIIKHGGSITICDTIDLELARKP